MSRRREPEAHLDATVDGRVVVGELVVRGWSRRRADRFVTALQRALPAAIADAVRDLTPTDVPEVRLRLTARERRDPALAAEAVAAAIAARATEAAP